jgi:hypothetical protein
MELDYFSGFTVFRAEWSLRMPEFSAPSEKPVGFFLVEYVREIRGPFAFEIPQESQAGPNVFFAREYFSRNTLLAKFDELLA